METYNGHVRTPADAIILFEACRLGLLPRVQRRLSEKERQSIRSGSVFVWDEREAGMRRWTDGKSWSASRVSGSFLTYREMEGKRGGNSLVSPGARGTKTPDSGTDEALANGDAEEGPDGYRYKPDGLMKQSFSITTSQGQHLHLISYYSRSHPTSQVLRQPSTDPNLASIQPAKGLYPESTINDQSSVPAVTRSPMIGVPSYVMSPTTPGYHRPNPASPQPYLPPGYIPHATYIYPISPLHTPPGHYALQGYAALPPGLPPLAYPAPTPYPPPPMHLNHAPPLSFDQRPLRNMESRSSVPPPPPPAAAANAIPPSLPPYSASQSQPAYAPYQPSTAPAPAAPVPSAADAPSDKATTAAQIDPRLTNSSYVSEPRPNGDAPPPEASQGAPAPARQPESAATTTASQTPSISTLVHNIATSLPTPEKQDAAEADRQASASPGGTKNGAPPQDIPSEKLGFREDKRALSKLDRVFAQV